MDQFTEIALNDGAELADGDYVIIHDEDTGWDSIVMQVSGCGDFVPCDTNCDGVVDTFDIEPFLGLLFNNEEPCGACAGDTNGDGVVDAFDIEAFLICLFP